VAYALRFFSRISPHVRDNALTDNRNTIWSRGGDGAEEK